MRETELLREADGYGVLREWGVQVPEHRVASDLEEARNEARSIGFPLVMKVISPDVVHKSDAGGVVLGIEDEEALVSAYRKMQETVRSRRPDARIEGVLLAEQLSEGLELIVGGKTDLAFGKVITFGIGGTLVELLEDVAIRVLPIGKDEVREMVREIRGYPLIAGFRGAEPLDEEGLVSTLSAICEHFSTRRDIVEFDLNPLILYPEGCAVADARIYVGEGDAPEHRQKEIADPSLFAPESIALIGASTNPNKIGYALFRNILSFSGREYPVNPNAEELFGRKVYPSVLKIPKPVDTVIVAVPAPLVPEVIDEAGEKGARLAIIVSAGFRETGGEGGALEDRVLEVARRHNIHVIGPNCLGIMLPHRKLNATFTPSTPKPGHLAFISQSGAVINTMVDWSLAEGIGMSAVISVGNQADLSFEDFLNFAAEDPNTKAIVCYIEEVKNGRQFIDFAREVSDKKPIVAIKSGSSEKGQAAASSHTGSLAGSYEVYRAAFRQSGVITVHSLREAFNVAELLASEGYPGGARAVVVTSAGGFAVLSTDYAEENGIGLIDLSEGLKDRLSGILPGAWSHANPIDLVGDAGVDRYARVFDVLIGNQDLWDIAFVVAVPAVTLDPAQLAHEIVRFSRHTRRMVVGCFLGGETTRSGIRVLRNAHIPNFSDLEDAFRAVGLTLQRSGKKRG
ncbi:MAG: acetate--CoA ligase family protein [Methanomicrobiaceae archaeon]|nr:acetate--CoA ligase family protein [Methanomicrobiaceae archaeon]